MPTEGLIASANAGDCCAEDNRGDGLRGNAHRHLRTVAQHAKPLPLVNAKALWKNSNGPTTELPLVAEFLVRRGNKQLFINALSEAAVSPGLTLLLIQMEEMIALNFTVFTAEEYTWLTTSMESIKRIIPDFRAQAALGSTPKSYILRNVYREVAVLCGSVLEGCRKGGFCS